MINELTIWIVDDDVSVRKAVKRLVRSAGYTSRTFASAREFFNSDVMESDGILILDIRMPGMSGLEVQKQLVDTGSDIPLIFITAHEDPQVRETAMTDGAIAFILKPFNDQTLLDAINLASQGMSR
jgi:FixJ family two-component response regulator